MEIKKSVFLNRAVGMDVRVGRRTERVKSERCREEVVGLKKERMGMGRESGFLYIRTLTRFVTLEGAIIQGKFCESQLLNHGLLSWEGLPPNVHYRNNSR